MAHRFEHVCLIISDLEGESKEKNLPGVIYKMKNGEMEAKRVPDHVENVYKLQEIFTTVKLLSLCHCYERLAVLKNVFTHYSALSNKRLQKLFKVTVHK